MQIQNPVITGFNPDPSLLRVGNDYYIAVSTFEWFPAVGIYHSTDLVNWELADYALKDDKELDMTGIDAACGVWAPNLTFNNGLFYLAYTLVYTNRKRHKDTYNFVVTAPSIHGPWSKPIALNRSGFDPSVFHDTDGRKYFVNMTLDYRDGTNRFSGIDVQELDMETGCLLGQPVRVFGGTFRGTTEGPNIFKRGDWYYLMCAEGDTATDHCAVMARSKSVWGPYEESPFNPVLTAVGNDDCRLKRAGHAQIIDSPDGNWYMAHLCARPLDGNSILGRETAIQNVEWTEDGWICLTDSKNGAPRDFYTVPGEVKIKEKPCGLVDFSKVTEIPLDYMSLRRSAATQGVRIEDGVLRITGGCSLFSKYFQGLLARRQQAFDVDFLAAMKFEPRHLNHLAGIQAYYNYDNYFNLRMTRNDTGKVINVTTLDNTVLSDSEYVTIPEETEVVYLKFQIRHAEIRFFYSFDNKTWNAIGGVGDMRHISDEHIEGNGFTGSMLGVSCQDIQGDGVEADFLWIDYKEY